jgi:hypothetical protein
MLRNLPERQLVDSYVYTIYVFDEKIMLFRWLADKATCWITDTG